MSPWVPTLTRPFSNNPASADSRLGTKKNALYYFAQWANRGSYFLFVCSYTTAIISPYFRQGWACKGNLGFSHFAPTRNVGTTDDLGRRFRCYQQERSNLLLDHSVTSRVQRKSVLQPAIRASCSQHVLAHKSFQLAPKPVLISKAGYHPSVI